MGQTKTSRGAGNQRERQNGNRPAGQVVQAEPASDGEHDAQADFEGVEQAATVEFAGEQFRLASKVSYLPLLKFAHYASKGTDSASMQGMAAMYEMLRSCFERGEPCGECEICTGDDDTPARPRDCESRTGDEWPRFEDAAIASGADDEELFAVVTLVMEAVAARPTRRRSGSSQPAPPTSPRSKGRSPDQADGLVSIDDLAR